ncbi:ABC transporter substrate-binding protein [Bradyrhizobium iriomotense]|uniref:ABC transporter substrate-binding protein n=2 Tax=Bradyrhizobium iriomotense TaxID=441950 RepID=A0ABQ6B3A6_9BRAD|nr:ABC transporter substrate-binding protein [Bradyrhizobium iriomotense]
MTGLAGAVGASLIGPGGQALGQSGGRLVVGTWGGDYARLLDKHIDKPFLVPAGYEVIQDLSGDPERRAKMLAEKRLRRGSSDIQALADTTMYQVFDQGLTHEIDYSRIPNAKNLLANMRPNFGVYGIYSGMVVLFNPDRLPTAPTSYAEILDPKFGSNIGVIDIQYRHNIATAALIAGGSVTKIEEGKRLLMELRRAGLRIYPTNEAYAQGLQTGEIIGGIMWKARALQWQAAGIKVRAVTPKEGFIPYISGFVIPKNAPNLDGAYAYLNAVLEPKVQLGFAVDLGYDGTVSNAGIPADLQARIGFSAEEVAKMNALDFKFFFEHEAEIKSWWDQTFKA